MNELIKQMHLDHYNMSHLPLPDELPEFKTKPILKSPELAKFNQVQPNIIKPDTNNGSNGNWKLACTLLGIGLCAYFIYPRLCIRKAIRCCYFRYRIKKSI